MNETWGHDLNQQLVSVISCAEGIIFFHLG